MIRTRLQQIVLASLCAMALILIPVSGSAVWAQSTTQPYQTDQSHQNLNNQNSDLNKDQNSDLNKDKSSSSQSGTVSNSQSSEPQTPSSNSQVDRNKNTSGSYSSSTTTRSTTSRSQSTNEVNQNADQNRADRDKDLNSASSLPRTAGELPVLALIGFLSLIAAAGTRLVVKTNR